MSQLVTARYGTETWLLGDRGNLHPHATERPQLINTRVYRDGSLGPRPRWTYERNTEPTAGDTLVWAARYHIGYGYGLGGSGFATVDANELFFYDWASADSPYAEQTTGTPPIYNAYTMVRIDEAFWLANDQLIEFRAPLALPRDIIVTDLNPALDAAFAGGGAFYCAGSTLHQSRAYFWGALVTGGTTYSNRNRLWYSDAYDYGTFTSTTQYLEFDGAIAGAVPVGANLFIWTEDAKWYILQGRGNPADMTINALGGGRVPFLNRIPAIVDNRAYFLASDKTTLVVLNENGELDDASLQHLGAVESAAVFNTTFIVGQMRPAGDSELNVLIQPIGFERARVMHDGVWMTEDWADVGIDDDNGIELVDVIYQDNGEMLAFEDPDVAGEWRVYFRNTSIHEPETAGAADDETVSCTVVLPRVSAPGESVRIRSVTVQCRTWSPTDPLPALAVSVDDGNNDTTAFSAGPDSGSVTAVGAGEESHEFIFTSEPTSFSAFADITLTFSGMVIEAVYVEFEHEKEPLV